MKEISINPAALIKALFVIGVLVALGYFMSISDRKTYTAQKEELVQKTEQHQVEKQTQLNAKKEDVEPSNSKSKSSFEFNIGNGENTLEKMKEKGGVTRSFDDFKK